MTHVDPDLKTYAEYGLRSAEDWATMGRLVKDGAQARTEILHRRQPVRLFGRDQTLLRTKGPEVAPAPASNG